MQLYRLLSGTVTKIAEYIGSYPNNVFHMLEVVITGNNIKINANKFAAIDYTLIAEEVIFENSTKVGLRLSRIAGNDCLWDNFKVEVI